ncbi:dihydrolipoyl dehydrogenase family protein [Helicovermis profundi]|uniref:Mercuric reductase n=1 Tax=Helicovermis profundi TaxID=3065157 RepID=A0AAU9EAJ4_9FIRM|nr:hypothetical protein HLPR_21430 [Clostridia bacterium S502]
MKFDYNIIVLGAGSAGLVVASAGAGLGAKIALIENEKMGGDCLNAGCVPSKTFLKSAHLAKDISSSSTFGIDSTFKEIDLEKIMNRVKSVIKSIEPHDSKERYEKLGVDVFFGNGVFVDKNSIEVNGKVLTAKNIVIATGSEAVVPNIKGLSEVDFLTNRNIFDLKILPKHLIVLGGGPIGLELGQGFRHLGSKVTIIDRNERLFRKDDPEVAPIMEKVLKNDGVDLLLGFGILEVKKADKSVVVVIEKDGIKNEIIGDNILVSLGRAPVSKGMNLEKIGVKLDKRGSVITNLKLQTSVKNIYAAGDITGPYQFTHMASYQAGVVIRNIIFRLGTKVNYSVVPWTTYTKPEVTHVGYTEPWAKSLGLFKESLIIDLKENDRAKAENDIDGFLKIILDDKARIIGASLVGEKAGEMIPIVTLAIKKKLKTSVFLNMIFSYPTEAEIFASASLIKVRNSFKSWQKNLIKKLFL